jgi:Uma2 family endonuclease
MQHGGAPIHRLTFDDVVAMSEAGVLADTDRVELEDGLLVDVMPVGPEHSGAVTWLTRHFAGARSAWDVRVQDILLIEDGFLSPDLLVVEPLPRTALPHTARLAIEVAMTSHARDRHKAELYALALVHEYWLVDLVAREVVCHSGLQGGSYADVQRHGPGTTVAAPEGIDAIDVGALLG